MRGPGSGEIVTFRGLLDMSDKMVNNLDDVDLGLLWLETVTTRKGSQPKILMSARIQAEMILNFNYEGTGALVTIYERVEQALRKRGKYRAGLTWLLGDATLAKLTEVELSERDLLRLTQSLNTALQCSQMLDHEDGRTLSVLQGLLETWEGSTEELTNTVKDTLNATTSTKPQKDIEVGQEAERVRISPAVDRTSPRGTTPRSNNPSTTRR